MARFFDAFEASFIDAIFDLTSDERWAEEAKHFSERHLISKEEAQGLSRRNPSQMHSFFNEDWDANRIKDEIVLETMGKEAFLKQIMSSARDGFYGVLIPIRNCGTAVTCIRDDDNEVIGFAEEPCNVAVVVFSIELDRSAGYEVIYRMSLRTVYPANQALIRRERTGKF